MKFIKASAAIAAITFAAGTATTALALSPKPTDPDTSSSSGGSSGGTEVPEPSSMLLFGAGTLGLMAVRRRKKAQ